MDVDIAAVFASTELVADSAEAASMLRAAASHQLAALVGLEEEGVDANHRDQAFAQQAAVEAAHSRVPLSGYSNHDSDLVQPLSQGYPVCPFCTALDIAMLVAAVLRPDQHRCGREVSMTPNAFDCLLVSDRASSVQSAGIIGYWRLRIQLYRVSRCRARSDWTGPRKMVEVFADTRAAGRLRSYYLQTVVANLRSYLSRPARGTRLRRRTIRPVLTSSHSTRLRRR